MSFINFRENLIKIKTNINSEIDNEKLEYFFKYLEKKYNIEKKIIKKYFKRRVSEELSYIKPEQYSNISVKILNKQILSSVIIYFGFKILIKLFSIKSNKKLKSKIIVDDIKSTNEIRRMTDLFSNFKKNDLIFVVRKNFKNVDKNINFFIQEDFKNYSKEILKGKFRIFDLTEFLFLIKYSFKSKLNLFIVYKNFINDFFYYSSLFSNIQGKIIIQERILGRTNIIKNYLFKKYHKGRNIYMQTHLLPYDTQALFFDCDIFFSLGKKSFSSIKNLSCEINEVIPIGSHSLNYYYSNKNYLSEEPLFFKSLKKSYDILFIGSNVTFNTRNNWEGYYETISWLKNLGSQTNLNVFIMHHENWPEDKKEFKITKNSNLEYLPKHLNSYYFALKANVIITYCSTMALELLPFKTVYFTDPFNNNNFLNDEFSYNNLILKTYKEFKNTILHPKKISDFNIEDFGYDYKKTKLLLESKINSLINF